MQNETSIKKLTKEKKRRKEYQDDELFKEEKKKKMKKTQLEIKQNEIIKFQENKLKLKHDSEPLKIKSSQKDSRTNQKTIKHTKPFDKLWEKLPTAGELLTAPSQSDHHVSVDADLDPSRNATTTNHKTRRRKVSNHAVSASNDTGTTNKAKKSTCTVSRSEEGKKGKPSSVNSSSPTTEDEHDSSEDEETNSEDSEDEVDYQLDKVLIDSKNCRLLSSSRHFPFPTQHRLLNSTCREILASWLSMTQLNELVRIYGFKYKRGRFSNNEKAEIERMIKEFCKFNSITVMNFVSLSRTKSRRGQSDNSYRVIGSSRSQPEMNTSSLISRISRNLKGRPNTSIWHYIRRAYDTKSKQGPWTEEEENHLQEAVQKHGSRWIKISAIVGRSADDCRDRWRNYTVVKGIRNSGGWSQEEEDTLVELMSRSQSMGLSSGKDQVDGLWTWVSEEMGGSRSRAQCRIKWVESLKPKLDAEGSKINWTNRDVLTLAQKLKQHDLQDEVGFDWKLVTFGTWNPALLQRRWKQIKKFVIKKKFPKNDDSSDLQIKSSEVLEEVLDRWSHKSEEFLNSRVRFARSDENI